MKQKENHKWKTIDVVLIFKTIDIMADAVRESGGTGLLTLLRDKVLFYLMYALALRPSEVLSLNTKSFRIETDKQSPWKGKMVVDFNIGHARGHLRQRTLPILNDKIAAMLKEYLVEVRPFLVIEDISAEIAMFLSSQGERLSYSLLHHRFDQVLEHAGLQGQGYTLHSLRYTSISQLSLILPASYIHYCTSCHPRTTERFMIPSKKMLMHIFAGHLNGNPHGGLK